MPATEPEVSITNPCCAICTRYRVSSAQVSAAKVLPQPPASTATKTALKISTPIIEARTVSGSGRISTVSTISTQAQMLHRRSEVHQGPRACASDWADELADEGVATPPDEVCSDNTLS